MCSCKIIYDIHCTCACMQAWCDKRGFDTAIHPIPKCVIFLEDLLEEMVGKKIPLEQSRLRGKLFPRSGTALYGDECLEKHCNIDRCILVTSQGASKRGPTTLR